MGRRSRVKNPRLMSGWWSFLQSGSSTRTSLAIIAPTQNISRNKQDQWRTQRNENRLLSQAISAIHLENMKQSPPEQRSKFSANFTVDLMKRHGFTPCFSAEAVDQAVKISRRRQGKILKQTKHFFRTKACFIPSGLETLPDSWLAGLPGILWSLRKPHWTRLPYFISRVAVVEGVLLLEFFQEQPDFSRITAWDKIRLAVNAGLYPNRWRPFNR